MLRTLSAVALAAMIGASAAIAQDVAVVPTQTISAKTVKSVCRKLRKDDSFAEIRARLAKKKTDVFQFWKIYPLGKFVNHFLRKLYLLTPQRSFIHVKIAQ